jgi:hypothetical protein
MLDSYCFSLCSSLSSVTFQSGSRLRALGERAFENCALLKSISLPGSIESVNKYCFSGCSLSVLIFELPSHLCHLALSIPGAFSGEILQIPDSVENLSFGLDVDWNGHFQVDFDRDSRLRSFLASAIPKLGSSHAYFHIPRKPPVFVRFSEATLKAFRVLREFRV